jgi:DMSO/TMAO reductase YedYZ heme-binding membrane subunit
MLSTAGGPAQAKSRRRRYILGSICLVLMTELAVASRLVLRRVTGEDWTATCLILPFLLVCLIYGDLERWIWGTGRS